MSMEKMEPPPPVPPKPPTLKGNTPKNDEDLMNSKNASSSPRIIKLELKRSKSVSFSEDVAIIDEEKPCCVQVEGKNIFVEVKSRNSIGLENIHLENKPKPLPRKLNLMSKRQLSLESRSGPPPILPPVEKEPSPEISDIEDTWQVEVKRNQSETMDTSKTDLVPKLPPRGTNTPPPIPPKSEKLSITLNLETPIAAVDIDDSPATSPIVPRHKNKTKIVPRPTSRPPPPPLTLPRQISSASVNSDVQDNNSRVLVILTDILRREKIFIERVLEGIEMAKRFKAQNISEAIINKFFGFLEDIYSLHYQFHGDLQIQPDNSQYFTLCFLKHVLKLDVYIKRQWLVADESNLEAFEEYLLVTQNLKPYLNLTRQKLEEYLKDLLYFSTKCRENANVVKSVIIAVEDLYYQLEMVEQFKKIDDIENKIRDSGKVYLNHTFKVSLDGNKRKPYHIYFCENKIIFTVQNKTTEIYQYVDDILTSACYCSRRNHQPLIFEVGLIGRKRFIIKAESQNIKEKWCDRMRKVLGKDQLQD